MAIWGTHNLPDNPNMFPTPLTLFLPNEAQVVEVDVLAFPLLRAKDIEPRNVGNKQNVKMEKGFPNHFALQKRPQKQIESNILKI